MRPAQLGREQTEEESGEDRVEAERLRIAERATGHYPDDRAEHPAGILRQGAAEQGLAVEAAFAAGGQGPRRSLLPRSAAAAATPIGRKRAFSIAPVAIAVAALPPAASTDVAPNCEAPANTTADITIGATDPISGSATTPNEMPTTNAAAPKPIPARNPRRKRSRAAGSLVMRGSLRAHLRTAAASVPLRRRGTG